MTHNHIVNRPVSELKPSPSNARTHSDKQVGQIADSIRSFRGLASDHGPRFHYERGLLGVPVASLRYGAFAALASPKGFVRG